MRQLPYGYHALVLVVAAAACGEQPRVAAVSPSARRDAVAESAAPPSSTSPPRSGALCPGRDFAAFLSRFVDDTVVQARHTAFPLATSALENEGNEPREVERAVSRAEARFPLFSIASRRAADSLVFRSEEAAAGRRRVTLYKPDTDAQVVYLFAPVGECWHLVRMDDQSL